VPSALVAASPSLVSKTCFSVNANPKPLNGPARELVAQILGMDNGTAIGDFKAFRDLHVAGLEIHLELDKCRAEGGRQSLDRQSILGHTDETLSGQRSRGASGDRIKILWQHLKPVVSKVEPSKIENLKSEVSAQRAGESGQGVIN